MHRIYSVSAKKQVGASIKGQFLLQAFPVQSAKRLGTTQFPKPHKARRKTWMEKLTSRFPGVQIFLLAGTHKLRQPIYEAKGRPKICHKSPLPGESIVEDIESNKSENS